MTNIQYITIIEVDPKRVLATVLPIIEAVEILKPALQKAVENVNIKSYQKWKETAQDDLYRMKNYKIYPENWTQSGRLNHLKALASWATAPFNIEEKYVLFLEKIESGRYIQEIEQFINENA